MSVAGTTFTYVGTGTLYQLASTSAVSITPHADTKIGDLVVVVVRLGASATFVDAGDGWNFVSGAGAQAVGVMNARWDGSSGYAGITVTSAAAQAIAQTATFRLDNGLFDASKASGNQVASLTSAIGFPNYSQYIDLISLTFTQASSRTGTPPSGFTERFDEWNANPDRGVYLCSNNSSINQAAQHLPSETITMSGSVFGQLTTRICIPVVGNVNAGAARQRMASGRRFG